MSESSVTGATALLALYVEKRSELIRFFALRTGSVAEAQDVVQDIYLKIAGISGADGVYNRAFLYQLGTNVMLDRIRARRRADHRDQAYFDTAHVVAHGEVRAEAPDPDAALDARRRLARLREAILDLPPQCQRVFVMHKFEGLTYGEVASALGISRSAVEKHMMSALRRLSGDAP